MEEDNRVTENIVAEASREESKNGDESSQLVSSDDKSPDKRKIDVDREAIVPQQFSEDEIQNLHEIFKLFDKNDNGYIESSDLKNIMDSLNRDPAEGTLHSRLVDEIMNSVDPNQDGKLSFDEFIKMMGSLETKLKTVPSAQPKPEGEEGPD